MARQIATGVPGRRNPRWSRAVRSGAVPATGDVELVHHEEPLEPQLPAEDRRAVPEGALQAAMELARGDAEATGELLLAQPW